MSQNIKEIRKFEALAADGSRALIIEFQTVDLKRTVNGKLIAIEGPIRFALADGSQVKRMPDGKTYRVQLTGQMLREDD